MAENILKNMDISQILKYHNCRYPCLMIDYMEEVIPGNMFRGGVAMGKVEGFVNSDLACSADFVIGIPSVIAKYTPHP